MMMRLSGEEMALYICQSIQNKESELHHLKIALVPHSDSLPVPLGSLSRSSFALLSILCVPQTT